MQIVIMFLYNTSRSCCMRVTIRVLCGIVGALLLGAAVIAATPAAQPSRLSDRERADEDTALAELGRSLFFAPELSANGTISCATCHVPAKAFSDGRRVALGIGNLPGTRNTPSLPTAESALSFFWDGRRSSLETLMFDPITNPSEMGFATEKDALTRLKASKVLSAEFAKVFTNANGPTRIQVESALAQFVRTIPSEPSAYDRYLEDEKRFPLSAEAMQGLSLFRGKAKCSECHPVDGARPTFTDNAFHHSSVGWDGIARTLPELTEEVIREDLRGRELGERVSRDSRWAALGHFVVSHEVTDIAAFRTPSLRNISLTAPYMHDGSVPTLSEAIDVEVYYRSLASGRPLNISPKERQSIIVFLNTLSSLSLVSSSVAD